VLAAHKYLFYIDWPGGKFVMYAKSAQKYTTSHLELLDCDSVNLPARLVIVKGGEYYDGKRLRYVDYPLTDVLQMVGRAGRPGFDTMGEAVVMVVEEKKSFYKKVSMKNVNV
jgi:hypothetical protein